MGGAAWRRRRLALSPLPLPLQLPFNRYVSSPLGADVCAAAAVRHQHPSRAALQPPNQTTFHSFLSPPLQKITVERRLYDIGSILCSVGLLERIYMKKR